MSGPGLSNKKGPTCKEGGLPLRSVRTYPTGQPISSSPLTSSALTAYSNSDTG